MPVKWFTLLLICLIGCVKPFELKKNAEEELLVVEGLITNLPGPYTIKLSKSSAIDNIRFTPLSNCTGYIEDRKGSQYQLIEIEAGKYQTDSLAFTGKVGESYKLNVSLPNGKRYESTWEKIMPPIQIDTVYAEFEEHIVHGEPLPRYGYQFFIDAIPTSEDSINLIWQLDVTYEFNSDFKIQFMYDGRILPFPDPEKYFTCYKYFRVPDIFLYSTAAKLGNEINRIPLHFEDTKSRALTNKYAINTLQLSVSKAAYNYWDELNTLKEMNGSFFDKQPFQINGNIQNSEDTDEDVIGYFMTAGADHNLNFFEWKLERFDYSKCQISDVEIMAFGDLFREPPPPEPIWITTGLLEGPMAVVPTGCLDCREKGGTLQKPSFWK